jgi:hypothetical protein
VILTMRLEFLGRCASFEGLSEAIDSNFKIAELGRSRELRFLSKPMPIHPTVSA